jgi:hypothetical protein
MNMNEATTVNKFVQFDIFSCNLHSFLKNTVVDPLIYKSCISSGTPVQVTGKWVLGTGSKIGKSRSNRQICAD